MKENEVRKRAKCGVCGKPFGHTGLPLFWVVKVQRCAVDLAAARRQDGLAAMLGNSLLANVMGPDEDMAKVVQERELTVCEECALKEMTVHELMGDADA